MEVKKIAFFGATNSGKSTLVNAIAGQEVSLVSEMPGTTTDPVRKRIELPGLGPCVLIDTAGLDDDSPLGSERQRLTRAVLDEADLAVWVRADVGTQSTLLLEALKKAGIPTIIYERGESVKSLLELMAEALPKEEEKFLTGNLVKAGETVVLVMPQDSEAPKGRLILPQVQVIRELLDRGCNPLCTTPESLPKALESLKTAPALVITDSQVFSLVAKTIAPGTPLTSFSILLAAAKGDINVFLQGSEAIDRLSLNSRVLIAEACTHVPDTEDIGRVKIPTLLRNKAGMDLVIDIAAGNDFPEDLSPYDLIIHCGACVATATLVRARTRKALLAGVPITNYGLALAKLKGILNQITLPITNRHRR